MLAVGALVLLSWPASAAKVKYYHLDALGSVRVVTDSAGNVVERHDYPPFGDECTTGGCAANPGLGAGEPRKFTGKERDTETGLDYFGARYLAARTGRFTTTDPVYSWNESLLDPQRWNRYVYGRDNPLKYVDRDGRDAVWVKHADGTATLVIPVTFSGTGASEANSAAIVSRINSLTILDPNVSIQAILTDKPIRGKLNTLDVSPGLDTKMCGAVGECANRVGGNKGHIDSTDDIARKGAHEILHMAGIDDAYIEGPRDEKGRRTSSLKPGFTNSNVMTSREGTELKASQLQEAKNNRTTKKCSGSGAECR